MARGAGAAMLQGQGRQRRPRSFVTAGLFSPPPGPRATFTPFYAAFGAGPTFTILRQKRVTFTQPPPYGGDG